MDKTNIYEEKRPWGSFRRFTLNEKSTVKIITVNKNEVLSLQSHSKRSEFWKVLKGEGVFEVDGLSYRVKEGDELEVPKGSKHRISSSSDTSMEVLEIAYGEFDEEDIIRYEDKYGRIK
jgi:mannose-1-phosphate guanylyltransferase/mannose-1-phosphate guanylyltransferase/mannose-6-phosphate isomerase